MSPPCPFCSITPERIVRQSQRGFVIRDGFPVSPGHTLVIPRRHVPSFFEVTESECADPRGGVRWVLPDMAAYWDRD